MTEKGLCVWPCGCLLWVFCVFRCSEQPSQHHPFSAAGLSSKDLQEAQFRQELQPLTVRRLHLTEHTLRTCTQTSNVHDQQQWRMCFSNAFTPKDWLIVNLWVVLWNIVSRNSKKKNVSRAVVSETWRSLLDKRWNIFKDQEMKSNFLLHKHFRRDCSFIVMLCNVMLILWVYRWPWAQWGGRWAGFGWHWCPPAQAGHPNAAERGSGTAASLGIHPGPPPLTGSSPSQKESKAHMFSGNVLMMMGGDKLVLTADVLTEEGMLNSG